MTTSAPTSRTDGGPFLLREPRRSRVNTSSRRFRWAAAAAGLGVLVLGWQIAAAAVADPATLPGPASVVQAAVTLFAPGGAIYPNLLSSGATFAAGFVLSLTAVPVGLLIGGSRVLRTMTEPLVAAIYALPRIALIPLIIVWFGVQDEAKIAIIFLGAFVMIAITVIGGAQALDREFSEMSQAFHVGPIRRFLTITVPGAVPFVFTALRLGVGRALLGVVAAELFIGGTGLGHLLGLYAQTFRVADFFVVLVVLVLLALALTALVDLAARRLDRWRA